MLDLTLFKRPAMVGVSLAAFTIAASIFALFLYLTLYIQDDLGYGPLAAGVRFLPITVLAFAVAPFAGKLTVRMQARYLLGTGMFFIAVGCLLMATTHASSGWTILLPGFIVAGIGIGTVNPVLASSAISVVPPERSGMASGANNTFRQVGIATGIAGLGTVFQTQIQHQTLAALGGSPAGQAVAAHGGAALQGALAGGGVREAMTAIPVGRRPARRSCSAYRVGFSATLDHLMVIGAVIAFIGSVASFALVRQRDFVPSCAPPPARTEARTGRPATAASPSSREPGDRGDRDGRTTAPRRADPAGPATNGRARPSPRRLSASSTNWATPGVSMESVASEAGVARATIYRRYRDKADLITAAIADNSSTHLSPGSSTDPRARPHHLSDRVRRALRRELPGGRRHADRIAGEPRRPGAPPAKGHRTPHGLPRSLLETAVELGLLDPDADLDLALQMLVGSVFARTGGRRTVDARLGPTGGRHVWMGMGVSGDPVSSAPARPPSARARG